MDTLAPVITNVTQIPEIISEKITVSADVAGDVNLVFLNIESVDSYGKSIITSIDMTGADGCYSADMPGFENGRALNVWVSAYSASGNKAESEKQAAIVMMSENGEPVIAVTAVNGDDVTVRYAGFDAKAGDKAYLALYSGDRLVDVKSANLAEEITFYDMPEDGYLKAYVWNDIKPLSGSADFGLFNITEEE